MSTTPVAAPHRQAPGEALSGQNEIKIVSHSNLFYWWPVWAVGFVMALLTWLDGNLMAIVPPRTEALRNARVEADVRPGEKVTYPARDVLVAPEGAHLHPYPGDAHP